MIFRNIFDGFDKIDGKPTQAELKAQAQAEQLKKKREVKWFIKKIILSVI